MIGSRRRLDVRFRSGLAGYLIPKWASFIGAPHLSLHKAIFLRCNLSVKLFAKYSSIIPFCKSFRARLNICWCKYKVVMDELYLVDGVGPG